MYKTWHDWVGNVIHWELCKKLKFDFTTKWYIHKPKPVFENETQKLLRDFVIQTDDLTLDRRPGLELVNKKENLSNRGFCCPADHWVKWVKFKENEKRDKYFDFARKLKKQWNMKVTVIAILIGALGTITKSLDKRAGGVGDRSTSGNHHDYNLIKIGQNSEKRPKNLRRLAITQTPMKDHQQTLV